jgi:hypothetical protein
MVHVVWELVPHAGSERLAARAPYGPTMTRLALALVLALTSAGAARAQHTASDLLPLAAGDRWTYVTSGPQDDGRRVEARVVRVGNGWSLVDGPLGRGWLHAARTTGTVRAFDTATGRAGTVFDLARPVGGKMDVVAPALPLLHGSVWVLSRRGVTAITPAGRFTGCVELTVDRPTVAGQGLERLVLAPGVGVVSYAWATPAGTHTATLIEGQVGGRRLAPRFVDRLASKDPSLWYYFAADRQALARTADADVTAGLRVDPNDALLGRIAKVRARIWTTTLAYRLDAAGQLPEQSAGVWLTGEVTDPQDGRRYQVVHWADIDDDSWSVYFDGDEVVSVYYEN